MVVSFFTPKCAHMKMKKLLTNYCPFSNKMVVLRLSYGITELLRKMLETWADVMFVVHIARVILLYLSVIITTNNLLDSVRGGRPKISVSTDCKVRLGINSLSFRR